MDSIEDYIRRDYGSELDQKFNSDFESIKEAIISYLKSNENIVVKKVEFGFNDFQIISSNDGFTPEDKLITLTEDGVSSRIVTPELIEIVVENLSKNISSLTVPLEILDKLDISNYESLKELGISGRFTLTKERLDSLTSMGIKDIKAVISLDESIVDSGAIIIDGISSSIVLYNGVKINNNFNADEFVTVTSQNPYDTISEVMSAANYSKDCSIKFCKKIPGKQSYADIFNHDIYYYKNRNEKNILSLENFDNISSVKKAIDEFESKGLPLDEIEIILENKDYDDINTIKEIEEKHNIILKYISTNETKVTIDEFITMRATLDYYTNLIKEANLSPLEQTIYAYDLIKSLEYEESENRSDSRKIHSIIRDGKIVCVGYSVFLSQLLSELGIECIPISAKGDTRKIEHQRNIVKLVDPKYGIDGSFALDATWDSAKNLTKVIDENGDVKIREADKVKETDVIEKGYDNFSLYRYFLIPASEYQTVFDGENLPDFKAASFSNPEDLVKDIEESFVTKEGLSNTDLLKAISVVRLKQGYSKEETIKSIEGIIEIQEYLKNKNQSTNDVVIKK